MKPWKRFLKSVCGCVFPDDDDDDVNDDGGGNAAAFEGQQGIELVTKRTVPRAQQQTTVPSRMIPQARDEAARLVTAAFRRRMAKEAYDHMIQDGRLWGNFRQERLTMRALSKQNISALRRALHPLTATEAHFYQQALRSRFVATHSTSAQVTDADGQAALFSRRRLVRDGAEFNQANTPPSDLSALATDDFVFFSLEAGDEPQKASSRFGDTMLRFGMEHPAFSEVSWMNLVDFAIPGTQHLEQWVPGLTAEEYESIYSSRRYGRDKMFFGEDMINGLILSVIKDCRDHIDAERRDMLLSLERGPSLNRLINGLFRPQILVPRQFFGRPESVVPITKNDHGF
jgi:hypothetical protein